MSERQQIAETVASVIRERKTLKVLGSGEDRAVLSPEVAAKHRETVLEALEVSGWAPFHFAIGEDGLAEPWRAHVFWHGDCQELADRMLDWFADLVPQNKILAMLNACGALVIVNWLPQHYDSDVRNAARIIQDEENLAAASAMVQNLLLMLTAHGMGTYWSSGGKLRNPAFFERTGIPANERLLAAVFVEYPETLEEKKPRIPGKHRHRRSGGWIREFSFPAESVSAE
ncbi:MAG: nitroreductase family protein [Acidobacteriota bacterium]